jgi:hypothetical protein
MVVLELIPIGFSSSLAKLMSFVFGEYVRRSRIHSQKTYPTCQARRPLRQMVGGSVPLNWVTPDHLQE